MVPLSLREGAELDAVVEHLIAQVQRVVGVLPDIVDKEQEGPPAAPPSDDAYGGQADDAGA